MDIIQIVNQYWPNTISKLAMSQDDLPEGIPFMGAFVELFEGATLPSESDVIAKNSDYNTYISKLASNAVIIAQIAVLETTQTPRRMREALADPTWINALNAQIATLRAQLT